MLQLVPQTIRRTIPQSLDTTGPSPDERAPYFEVPKIWRYRRPLYILFNWSIQRDHARRRVHQQRWESLTQAQQTAVIIQRWGNMEEYRRVMTEIRKSQKPIVQPA